MKKKLQIRTNFSEVTAEIRAVLESDLDTRNLSTVAMRVLNNHPKVAGTDADFHLCCSFRAVRNEVSRLLNQRKLDPQAREDTPMQFEFEHLKAGYNIERDHQQLHLPLEQLTFDELLLKAEEYDAMSSSLRAEAAELRRYAAQKFPDQYAAENRPSA